MHFDNWISPGNGEKLSLSEDESYLRDGSLDFFIQDGIPNLIYPKALNDTDKKAKDFYEGRADDYDKYLHLTFKTYNEDEQNVRQGMIDRLELSADSKVLEIACGTGRDSEIIARRLSSNGELHLQDISHDMIRKAVSKLQDAPSKTYFSLANASHITYPDNYFDALYSFGGIGEFSDIKAFFKEAVRVCKPGAKIVVGDENLPIWQRESLFGKILTNYNQQFSAEVPFKDLPVEAREVNCRWIIGGVFYLIDFKVGAGEPYADFDFEIPGVRGGTHKTRYYGQLEGVSQEAQELAWKAQAKSGKSMHQWLNDLVIKEAQKVLNK